MLHDRFVNTVKILKKSLPVDYHPKSDNQVVNLVHPSLFCLIYGLSVDKNGDIIQEPDWLKEIVEYPVYQGFRRDSSPIPVNYSHRYQWLPAEFLVDRDGNTKIASYINGLPSHVDGGLEMYSILGEIFKQTIPLFDQVLSSLVAHHDLVRFRKPDGYDWWDQNDGEPPYLEEEEDQRLNALWDSDPRGHDVAKREYFDTLVDRITPLPVPEYSEPPLQVEEEDMIRLAGHRLQVIVKIGSVELTPEKPDFKGGNWHVEVCTN